MGKHALLSVALLGLLVACATNPVTGKRELSLMSESQEIAVGKENHPQILREMGQYEDAELQRYVAGIGQRLAKTSERPTLPWTFTVVDQPVVNAFAVPGGFIYINRGLIERAENMSQVAGVLGHEIGHVTERHSIEQMEKQQGTQLGVAVGCILAPSVCNNQLGATAINLGAGAAFARFSRKDESESDTRAVEYTTRAGIDPRGIPEMFRILLDERQRNPSRLEAWFATHPLEEDRIRRTEEQIARIRPEVLQSLTKDTRAFQSFKSRLRSLPQATQASR
jgi:beta-barrel assembly-enhancing protease